MYDSRLIGTWKSDARKTAREITVRRDVAGRKRTKLQSLFGKLELRYTRGRCYSTLDGETRVTSYRVVAKDAYSVAVISSNPFSGEQIWHIHFEGKRYWISLGGRMREYFMRIDGKRAHKSL
jgi:hypothetical protein